MSRSEAQVLESQDDQLPRSYVMTFPAVQSEEDVPAEVAQQAKDVFGALGSDQVVSKLAPRPAQARRGRGPSQLHSIESTPPLPHTHRQWLTNTVTLSATHILSLSQTHLHALLCSSVDLALALGASDSK